MIENLTLEQIAGILDAMPVECMFTDENDRMLYANKMATRTFRFKGDKLLGKDIRLCHRKESLPKVEKMLDDLKSGRKDEDEFWVDSLGPKILNRFIAIRDKEGKYLGTLEFVMDYSALDEIAEQKKNAPRV